MKLHFIWGRIGFERRSDAAVSACAQTEILSYCTAIYVSKFNSEEKMLPHNLYVHPPCVCMCVCFIMRGLVITSAAASLECNQPHISHEPH